MTTETQSELEDFHEFLSGQLERDPNALSPEEALAQWREQQATLASIQRGLDDIKAGRVQPASEVLNNLGQQKSFNIFPNSGL